MLYVVYGCKIVSCELKPPYGNMELLGDPDVFPTLEDAVDCSITRSRSEETKLAIIIEVPEVSRPRVVAWYGLRPASYGLDFPGGQQDCQYKMDQVRYQLLSLEYITT